MIMHIDFNSCFASVEQQANPHLRGKPIAVAAYTTPSGCIIAPSVEAKQMGIKVGMRVKEGKLICKNLIVLFPDPDKYRDIHLKLKNLVSEYTSDFVPKSIDEFVLNLEDTCKDRPCTSVGKEIKQRIKEEIGDWLRVSIGIGPNRFLAKLAAGLHKPDGLDVIDKNNYAKIYSGLSLTDLCGIKMKNCLRLNSVGVYSVDDFYNADVSILKAAFASINGYYWYLRLRGWEIDDVEFGRHSYGNSYALPQSLSRFEDLSPILMKLCEKMGFRLRRAGFSAKGIHLALIYKNGSFWHKGCLLSEAIFDTRDIYKKALLTLKLSPFTGGPVSNLAVSCFSLENKNNLQLNIFSDLIKKQNLSGKIDEVNNRWGNFVITPARMLMANKESVPDRIAFGGIKELEEIVKAV